MRKLTKADFDIRGEFTNSRISGTAPYIYQIYAKGEMFNPIDDAQWTSKYRASRWLGMVIRMFNAGMLSEEYPSVAAQFERLYQAKLKEKQEANLV